MYYNPSTKEVLSAQEVRNLVNASFPDNTEEVHGWHLIDTASAYPSLEPGQHAVEGPIEERNGKYVQTYEVKDNPSAPVQPAEDSDRVALLEKAVEDLAQMVSNLEEYRIWKERQEAGEDAEEPESQEN